MWSKRDIIVFLAGAFTFHTLAHLTIAMTDTLPIRVFNIIIDKQMNLLGIVVNGLIASGLIWWANKTR